MWEVPGSNPGLGLNLLCAKEGSLGVDVEGYVVTRREWKRGKSISGAQHLPQQLRISQPQRQPPRPPRNSRGPIPPLCGCSTGLTTTPHECLETTNHTFSSMPSHYVITHNLQSTISTTIPTKYTEPITSLHRLHQRCLI